MNLVGYDETCNKKWNLGSLEKAWSPVRMATLPSSGWDRSPTVAAVSDGFNRVTGNVKVCLKAVLRPSRPPKTCRKPSVISCRLKRKMLGLARRRACKGHIDPVNWGRRSIW